MTRWGGGHRHPILREFPPPPHQDRGRYFCLGWSLSVNPTAACTRDPVPARPAGSPLRDLPAAGVWFHRRRRAQVWEPQVAREKPHREASENLNAGGPVHGGKPQATSQR